MNIKINVLQTHFFGYLKFLLLSKKMVDIKKYLIFSSNKNVIMFIRCITRLDTDLFNIC